MFVRVNLNTCGVKLHEGRIGGLKRLNVVQRSSQPDDSVLLQPRTQASWRPRDHLWPRQVYFHAQSL